MNIKEALETTKTLTPTDKALLAHCLISSLETIHDTDVDTAWADLSEKRYDEIFSGSVKTVSWEQVKKSVKG